MVFTWAPGRRMRSSWRERYICAGGGGRCHLERCCNSRNKNSKAVLRVLLLSQNLKSSWEQVGNTGQASDGPGGTRPVGSRRKLQPLVPTWECWLLAQLARSPDFQDDPELQVVFLFSFFLFCFNDYAVSSGFGDFFFLIYLL